MKSLKILVVSDLHLESVPFVSSRAAVDVADMADVVVLAGDIHLSAHRQPCTASTFWKTTQSWLMASAF